MNANDFYNKLDEVDNKFVPRTTILKTTVADWLETIVLPYLIRCKHNSSNVEFKVEANMDNKIGFSAVLANIESINDYLISIGYNSRMERQTSINVYSLTISGDRPAQ